MQKKRTRLAIISWTMLLTKWDEMFNTGAEYSACPLALDGGPQLVAAAAAAAAAAAPAGQQIDFPQEKSYYT